MYAGRDVFEELQLCQRYCQDVGAGWVGNEESATTFSMAFLYETVMRANPVLTILSSSILTRIPQSGAVDRTITGCAISSYSASARGAWIVFTNSGGNVSARAIHNRDGSSVARADAEL